MEEHKKRMILLVSILANAGMLAVFKYYNFFYQNFTVIAHIFHQTNPMPLLSIILPIGLSFHTFQAMSYTIEVYRGNQKAERHLGIYALYVMFYPQLVAGPIERPQNLLHQFYEKKYFDADRVRAGLQLMFWGFFKKVVIADNLATLVNPAYNHIASAEGWALVTATYCFAFQIYCDFSGYSDIAIGAAKVMGFDLMNNFRNPYLSRSIAEFWQRWHISLSSWFRDYLYIPLGGNRVSRPRWLLNLMVVFLVSGLWHGANWTFICWGAMHGIYLLSAILVNPVKYRVLSMLRLNAGTLLRKIISVVFTFNLVSFAWIFFRAASFSDACQAIGKMGNSIRDLVADFKASPLRDAGERFLEQMSTQADSIGKKALIFLVILFLGEAFVRYKNVRTGTVMHYLYFIVIILVIVIFGYSNQEKFIYFQF